MMHESTFIGQGVPCGLISPMAYSHRAHPPLSGAPHLIWPSSSCLDLACLLGGSFVGSLRFFGPSGLGKGVSMPTEGPPRPTCPIGGTRITTSAGFICAHTAAQCACCFTRALPSLPPWLDRRCPAHSCGRPPAACCPRSRSLINAGAQPVAGPGAALHLDVAFVTSGNFAAGLMPCSSLRTIIISCFVL